MVLVEISRKFQAGEMSATARQHGFDTRRVFTDPEQRFALLLLQRSHR
jgi:uncharacterized SAM-dependent methyltransferase